MPAAKGRSAGVAEHRHDLLAWQNMQSLPPIRCQSERQLGLRTVLQQGVTNELPLMGLLHNWQVGLERFLREFTPFATPRITAILKGSNIRLPFVAWANVPVKSKGMQRPAPPHDGLRFHQGSDGD